MTPRPAHRSCRQARPILRRRSPLPETPGGWMTELHRRLRWVKRCTVNSIRFPFRLPSRSPSLVRQAAPLRRRPALSRPGAVCARATGCRGPCAPGSIVEQTTVLCSRAACAKRPRPRGLADSVQDRRTPIHRPSAYHRRTSTECVVRHARLGPNRPARQVLALTLQSASACSERLRVLGHQARHRACRRRATEFGRDMRRRFARQCESSGSIEKGPRQPCDPRKPGASLVGNSSRGRGWTGPLL